MKRYITFFIVFCIISTFRPRHTSTQKPFRVLSDSMLNYGMTMTTHAHILQRATDEVDTFYISIWGPKRDTMRQSKQ